MSGATRDKWPMEHRDQEGFPQSFKEDGRWINMWNRENRHGLFCSKLTNLLWKDKDFSNVPSDERVLDKTLPIHRPYWLKQSKKKKAKNPGRPGCRATWLGHATVLAEVDKVLVLTDPAFSERASMVQWIGPKRYRKAACSVSELPRNLNAVVISHNHYDHLDFNSVRDLHNRYGHGIHWFVPKDMGDWFTDHFSIRGENLHELVWWEEVTLPKTKTKFVLTPANHWGRRWLLDQNQALWGGWAVIGPMSRFWYSGDTAYCDVFKQVGQRHGPFTLTAIPIGAYEPRHVEAHVHVDPAEAVQLHLDVRSKKTIAIHWGTFKLSFEHYLDPKKKTAEALTDKCVPEGQFMIVAHGKTVEGAKDGKKGVVEAKPQDGEDEDEEGKKDYVVVDMADDD